jgi:hypothetical protein
MQCGRESREDDGPAGRLLSRAAVATVRHGTNSKEQKLNIAAPRRVYLRLIFFHVGRVLQAQRCQRLYMNSQLWHAYTSARHEIKEISAMDRLARVSAP